MDFQSYYARHAPALIDVLQAQAGALTVEPLRSAALHLLGRGKLYRPLLVLATAEALTGEDPSSHCAVAASTELAHTFTLIHDDLPCMDDAALRRGVATVHKQYGEATAVLAGDALLGIALEAVADAPAGAELSRELAAAVRQVIEGQSLDLQAEGQLLDQAELERIHRLKTGALLAACCAIGGRLAGLDGQRLETLRELGQGIGLAFQIRDDLLSVQGIQAVVGKSLDTDVAKAKSTYPALLGLAGAEGKLAQQNTANLEALAGLGCVRPELLSMMARAAVDRDR